MAAPVWFKRPILFAAGPADERVLEHVQRIFGCRVTGRFDEDTRAHLRGFQALMGLPPTGRLDEATAERIEAVRPMYTI